MTLLYTMPSAIRSTLIIVGALCLLFIILFFFIRRVNPLKKTPLWLVPFMWIVDLMNSSVKANIGKRWKIYSPWFLTLTIFVFFANISAVFVLDNPTGYLVITGALGFLTFLVIQITGITSLGVKGYLKGFLDPFPIMLPMNIISEFSLPISLALRLFGNLTSGTCISILVKYALGWIALPIMPFMNAIFDIFFGVIQVAVFVILSMIFTSMKVKDEDKIYS
ncbi:MAG: F0F1 ATP synthase subunit A [Acholeplasmatales bacterium]|nr:F0F1 ATP synthase subunit A [Acholeplasmatales bacterium]